MSVQGVKVISVIIYVIVLAIVMALIRTRTYGRHEALTFDYSMIATLLSGVIIWDYGFSKYLMSTVITLFFLFIINACIQSFFHKKLQKKMKKCFEIKEAYINKKKDNDKNSNKLIAEVVNNLQEMASAIVMPSFSRFIEETKFFNNPGGLIELIKATIRRNKFQQKKYRIRECFVENVNLLGPCRAEIKSSRVVNNEKMCHIIPNIINTDDLALEYADEKKGLICYDIIAIGSIMIIIVLLIALCFIPVQGGIRIPIPLLEKIILFTSAFAFIFISYALRRKAFDKRENIFYEFSYASVVIASYSFFSCLIFQKGVFISQYIILGITVATFLVHSFIYHRINKKFHNMLNKNYDELIKEILPDTEVNCTRRKFLYNLKIISEWSVDPFLFKKKVNNIIIVKKIAKKIYDRETDMRNRTKKIIAGVVPDICKKRLNDFFSFNKSKLIPFYIINIISVAVLSAVILEISVGF